MPRPSPEIRCETCDWREAEDDADYARCAVRATSDKPMKHKSEWCGDHSDLPLEDTQ